MVMVERRSARFISPPPAVRFADMELLSIVLFVFFVQIEEQIINAPKIYKCRFGYVPVRKFQSYWCSTRQFSNYFYLAQTMEELLSAGRDATLMPLCRRIEILCVCTARVLCGAIAHDVDVTSMEDLQLTTRQE